MNIGFDASRAFIDNKTGTENYSYQLLKHLLDLDHTNKYYVYLRPGNPVISSQSSVVRPRLAGSRFVSLKTSDIQTDKLKTDKQISENRKQKTENRFISEGKNLFITIPFPRLWTQAGLALQTFKDPLDVLFVPSHTLPIIRRPNLKTVITVHDLGAQYLPQAHQLKQRLYLNYMTYHQLKSAAHIIAVSQATKDNIIKKGGISPDKITVIYEGCNEKFKVKSSKYKIAKKIKKYNLTHQGYFLFVGTIQPRKNLERLIEAYRLSVISGQLSDNSSSGARLASLAKLVSSSVQTDKLKTGKLKSENRQPKTDNRMVPALALVGSKGWLSDPIYELPKKLGVQDQVHFLGYIPDKDMPALYAGAKALLFPSLFEGFGLPILEAFACGCPVLTSNTSSMPEIAGQAAILVDPYCIEDITKGIIKISQPPVRAKLVKEGFKQIKKFSWEKAAKETLRVLELVKFD